ncbi:MAG TPA: YbaK/EbsC family protein [Mycobacteriales bacterium]
MDATHPNVVAVQAALRAAGAAGEIRILADAAPTAAAAAEQLGVQVGAIANSLIFDADGTAVLILTSGAHRVDTAFVGEALGCGLTRATPELVRAATGQPIGGVAPVGHPTPVRTLVDEALADYPEVWAAGGVPHAVFPTSYDELVHMTGGTPIRVVPGSGS